MLLLSAGLSPYSAWPPLNGKSFSFQIPHPAQEVESTAAFQPVFPLPGLASLPSTLWTMAPTRELPQWRSGFLNHCLL